MTHSQVWNLKMSSAARQAAREAAKSRPHVYVTKKEECLMTELATCRFRWGIPVPSREYAIALAVKVGGAECHKNRQAEVIKAFAKAEMVS